MICDLSAAIDLEHRNAVVAQHVLAASGQAQCIDGAVLGEPDFVRRAGGASIGERLHRAPGGDVIRATQSPHRRSHDRGDLDAHAIEGVAVDQAGRCAQVPDDHAPHDRVGLLAESALQ